MPKLLAILQIKCRRKPDFLMWLKWYTLYLKCDKICIIDDASPVSIAKVISSFYREYMPSTNIIVLPASKLDGFTSDNVPRQVRNANIGLMALKPHIGDIVITPDDDEFWWYDTSYAKTFINTALKVSRNTFTIPWILMSSHTPLKCRSDAASFADCFTYAAPTENNEVKFVMKYDGTLIRDMHWCHSNSVNLMPGTRYENFFRTSWVNKTNSVIKCYHFRTTTEVEYNKKIKNNINDKLHTRFYAKGKTFYTFDKQMYPGFPGYTYKDLTVTNIIARLS